MEIDPPRPKKCAFKNGVMLELKEEKGVEILYILGRPPGNGSDRRRVGSRKEKSRERTSGAPPYNKLIERTAGGRHGPRLRESRAGSPSPLPSGAGLGPSSPLTSALYGRNQDSVNVDDLIYRRAA